MKKVDFHLSRERMVSPNTSVASGPPLSSLLQGKAIGGPRDGAKLSAPSSWDGKVRRTTVHGESLHPGRYRFDYEGQSWVWEVNQPKKERK